MPEDVKAQPPTYQCLLSGGVFQQNPNQPVTPYYSLFLPNPTFSGGNEYAGNGSPYMQFWVLVDKNPLTAPQQFAAPDYNTVPNGLAALMNNQHLLVCGYGGSASNMPQGALYNFLMANGAGSSLTALEMINTQVACGTGSTCTYGMASIPGQGPGSGIEFLQNPTPVTYAAPNITSWNSQFAFVLMPDGAGGYVPYASL